MSKKIMLAGDRPTGMLHLGHYCGSIKSRVKKQDEYKCFSIIADLHVLTTNTKKESVSAIKEASVKMCAMYLACGIDPDKTIIFIQSSIPEIYKMNLILGMLTPFNRVSGIPTIKDMASNSSVKDISLGLYNYPVLQSADILLFDASVVPVGKDNESHLELTRHLAKKVNRLYGDPLIVPKAEILNSKVLPGTDGKSKMSKSLGNCIFLTDSNEDIKRKVMKMYTDPNRVSATSPGNVEGNPVFEYLYEFDEDLDIVNSFAKRYREGTIKDVEVKNRLVEVLCNLISPIRERYEEIMKDTSYVNNILKDGSEKARNAAVECMNRVASAMGFVNLLN